MTAVTGTRAALGTDGSGIGRETASRLAADSYAIRPQPRLTVTADCGTAWVPPLL